MIKISHELPLELLEFGLKWNDYDYLLPSFWKYEEYKQYFLKAKAKDRFIIMDNGLFEGDKFSTEELLAIINLIKPNIFIVPDIWNDTEETYKKAWTWMKYLKSSLPEETKLMAVLQGDNIIEMTELYDRLIWIDYKHIAINHASAAYGELGWHSNDEINKMNGRVTLISMLQSKGQILEDHYIHLLGCSLPQELTFYKHIKINSIDTSSPIINGYFDCKYQPWGLLEKPLTKIKDIYQNKDFLSHISSIKFNVKKFKTFIP